MMMKLTNQIRNVTKELGITELRLDPFWQDRGSRIKAQKIKESLNLDHPVMTSKSIILVRTSILASETILNGRVKQQEPRKE